MSSSSFSGGGGFSPQRSGGYASSEGTVSSDGILLIIFKHPVFLMYFLGMTSMEDTMQALNLSASQKREDLRRWVCQCHQDTNLTFQAPNIISSDVSSI